MRLARYLLQSWCPRGMSTASLRDLPYDSEIVRPAPGGCAEEITSRIEDEVADWLVTVGANEVMEAGISPSGSRVRELEYGGIAIRSTHSTQS